MEKISQKALILASIIVLASCSTVSYKTSSSPEFDLYEPLKVPALESFKDTSARTLEGQYHAVDWESLPGWDADDAEAVWLTFTNNCRGLMRPIGGSLTIPARATPQAWQPVCEALAQTNKLSGSEMKQFIEQHLQPWQLNGTGLATGYYEPVIKGSKSRHGDYQWPMYATPNDLLTVDLGDLYPELAGKRVRGKLEEAKVIPYKTREEINNASNKPPVLVWAEDPVEAFFMQVQGSGRVELDNGESIRLAYDNHNGHPYTSIGRWLADQGELSLQQASMQNIKQWAKDHPERIQEMLNVNKAMVFFKEEPIQDERAGPKGAYGIPLIKERTVAVDPKFVPLGTPLFVSTSHPNTEQPLDRIVFAQDTGQAIKGVARLDYFWGSGAEAGELAGQMKQDAKVWLLWPKSAGEPSAR